MSNCIAIDASSDVCSVALVLDGQYTCSSSAVPKSHANSLLPFVSQLLADNKISLSDLDFIACSEGPGSFTGLRIGLGVAQGLAYGAGKPMVEVSSLEAMARAASGRHPDIDFIVPLLDARMGEMYWSLARNSQDGLHMEDGAKLDAVADMVGRLKELAAACEGALLLAGSAANLLDPSALPSLGVRCDLEITPTAEQIAVIALEKWHRGLACNPQSFQLNYLRNSVSWNKRKRIRS